MEMFYVIKVVTLYHDDMILNMYYFCQNEVMFVSGYYP